MECCLSFGFLLKTMFDGDRGFMFCLACFCWSYLLCLVCLGVFPVSVGCWFSPRLAGTSVLHPGLSLSMGAVSSVGRVAELVLASWVPPVPATRHHWEPWAAYKYWAWYGGERPRRMAGEWVAGSLPTPGPPQAALGGGACGRYPRFCLRLFFCQGTGQSCVSSWVSLSSLFSCSLAGRSCDGLTFSPFSSSSAGRVCMSLAFSGCFSYFYSLSVVASYQIGVFIGRGLLRPMFHSSFLVTRLLCSLFLFFFFMRRHCRWSASHVLRFVVEPRAVVHLLRIAPVTEGVFGCALKVSFLHDGLRRSRFLGQCEVWVRMPPGGHAFFSGRC